MATSNDTPRTIEIQATQGFVAIVDEQDSDLALLKWKSLVRKNAKCYIARQITINGRYVTIYLHRVILERKIGICLETKNFVDHIDNNPLNNTRDNLRLATPSQNIRNSSIRVNNTSGYKGVNFSKRDKRWRAEITVDRKVVSLGWFGTAEEAYAAYCEGSKKYHGEFGRIK